jgi:hypothetical protein
MVAATATIFITSALVTLAAPGPAVAGSNAGNPNGGPPTATGGADPEGGDIFASVRKANWKGKGKGSCQLSAATIGEGKNLMPVAASSQLSMVETDGTKLTLYERRCGNEQAGQGTWVWVPQLTARDVAGIGLDVVRRKLSRPRAAFAPAGTDASPAVVHYPLWFAVSDVQWSPVSGTATVAGLSATVTAGPTRLILDPGDGGNRVSCIGPGPQWHLGMAEPARPPACSYSYRNASSIAPNGRSWPVQLTIEWRVNWTATNGEAGDLGSITTTSGYAIPVREIEAVEAATGRRS